MSVASTNNYCDPCIVGCNIRAHLIITITRIFYSESTGQWFADFDAGDLIITERSCDKDLMGCGEETSEAGVRDYLYNEFLAWLEGQLTPARPGSKPPLAAGYSGCQSSRGCNTNIKVKAEGGFEVVIAVLKQPLCPPCYAQVAVIDPVTVTAGPYQ
jgi:hypothetical protein